MTTPKGISQPRSHRDRAEDFYGVFDRSRRSEVRATVANHPEIVDEHRANPLEDHRPHSPTLQCVQNYLRSQPALGKYCICTSEPWLEYRIAVIVERGAPPVVLDEPVFASEGEAMHGVFVRRLADLAAGENEGA